MTTREYVFTTANLIRLTAMVGRLQIAVHRQDGRITTGQRKLLDDLGVAHARLRADVMADRQATEVARARQRFLSRYG